VAGSKKFVTFSAYVSSSGEAVAEVLMARPWDYLGQSYADIQTQVCLCAVRQSVPSAKPAHQCLETRAIFFTHCRELQCQSTAWLYTPYNCVGPDLSFLDKKLKFGRRTNTA
jgi:hypothetical protein